jgi:hypothetical protein
VKFRLLVATAVAVTGVGLYAGAIETGAHQAFPTGSCAAGALCVHWNTHETGEKYPFYEQNHSWNHGGICGGGAAHGHCWYINDDDSSSWNHGTTGAAARVFVNSQQDGWWPQAACMGQGDFRSHHDPNDAGSANTWPSGC